jgi:ribonuclease HI
LTGKDIYTDASKSENGVGLAVITKNTNICYKLSNQISIYTAEALAIITALNYIKTNPMLKYNIFTDSLSIIQSIQNNFQPNDISTLIINKIQLSKQANKIINIIRIPGHCNIHGNEDANRHSKNAATATETLNFNVITFSDIKKSIAIITHNTWQNHWSKQSTKLNMIKQNIEPWSQIHSSRKINSIINRLRIGHTRLTHGYLMDNKEPTLCSSCNEKLSIKHIITECRSYLIEKIKYNIPSNLYETIGPYISDNFILFLKGNGLDKSI